MGTCQICLKDFKNLRFKSQRISICGRCANDLNSYNEVAEESYKAARELLLRGMLRRATRDVSSSDIPLWQQQKAEHLLGNLEAEVDIALPAWINKLVADASNRSKIFKIIRAHRRGLLHFDRPHRWGYPSNWKTVASRIRKLDKNACVTCSTSDSELHVHHIVYASHFGTHRKTNLVTLCRSCHETEHERALDFGENLHDATLAFEGAAQVSAEVELIKPAFDSIVSEPGFAFDPTCLVLESSVKEADCGELEILSAPVEDGKPPFLLNKTESLKADSQVANQPPLSSPISRTLLNWRFGSLAMVSVLVGAAIVVGVLWLTTFF